VESRRPEFAVGSEAVAAQIVTLLFERSFDESTGMTWTDERPLEQPFAAVRGALSEVLDSKASSFSLASAQEAVTAFLRLRHQADAAYLHLVRVLGEAGSTASATTTFLASAPNHLSPRSGPPRWGGRQAHGPVGGLGRCDRWC